MVVAEIGASLTKTTRIPYVSETTFLDYDVLIIDLAYAVSGYMQQTKPTIDKRFSSLQDFLKFKKVPIILFTPTPKGWNNSSVHGKVDFEYFIPMPQIAVQTEHGTKFNINPNTIFTDFLNKYKALFHYQSFFVQKSGITIAETEHTKKPIAFYNDVSIFLPPLKSPPSQEDIFLSDLIEIAQKVKTQKLKTELPDWTKRYFLPGEKDRVNQIKSMQEKLHQLKQELSIQKETLYLQQQKKIMLSGTGKDLEKAIEDICRELGFEIIQAEQNRDDLIAKFNNRIAVMEIKGVSGTAAEKHASQLEKWVSAYHEEHDVLPKGILIVNGYKDSQLSDRASEIFPNQMLPYSQRREHCLISSMQLLGLYFEAVKHPEKKNDLVESLFNTSGVYHEFKNWTGFIEFDDSKS